MTLTFRGQNDMFRCALTSETRWRSNVLRSKTAHEKQNGCLRLVTLPQRSAFNLRSKKLKSSASILHEQYALFLRESLLKLGSKGWRVQPTPHTLDGVKAPHGRG